MDDDVLIERYKGHHIIVVELGNMSYGSVYENGTYLHGNIRACTPNACLLKCKRKIDMEEITYASYYNE